MTELHRNIIEYRAAGHSWSEVGKLCGISKSNAAQIYARIRSAQGVCPSCGRVRHQSSQTSARL